MLCLPPSCACEAAGCRGVTSVTKIDIAMRMCELHVADVLRQCGEQYKEGLCVSVCVCVCLRASICVFVCVSMCLRA